MRKKSIAFLLALIWSLAVLSGGPGGFATQGFGLVQAAAEEAGVPGENGTGTESGTSGEAEATGETGEHQASEASGKPEEDHGTEASGKTEAHPEHEASGAAAAPEETGPAADPAAEKKPEATVEPAAEKKPEATAEPAAEKKQESPAAREPAKAAGTPESTAEPEAEWTVLFYFCGSDLESQYGFASENLEEISNCAPLTELEGKVNALIETGGSSYWQAAARVGIDISPEVNTRLRVTPGEGTHGFTEEMTFPRRSMAEPETLTDFISWGTERYPAKKYALVLWNHGGGAKTGLLYDENDEGNYLTLKELRQALDSADVQFEAIVFDACMMASLETACAVKDHAAWMIASEEVVPGMGTAVGRWLQALYNHPECDGERLGRNICDMTQVKYANDTNQQARSVLTWSLIRLDQTDRVLAAFDQFFLEMGELLTEDPEDAMIRSLTLQRAEEYGDGQENMRDLSCAFYEEDAMEYIDRSLCLEMMDALQSAVRWSVRGPGRSEAWGLSFCLGMDFTPAELDIYAGNCPSPAYLAFLDAVTDWKAPEEVYREVPKLPEMSSLEAFHVHAAQVVSEDGIPALEIPSADGNLAGVYYSLYQVREDVNETVRLGRTVCQRVPVENGTRWQAHEPWVWLTLDGEICTVDLYNESPTEILYNIPLQIGKDTYRLRCGRIFMEMEYRNLKDGRLSGYAEQESVYSVYGFWEGYNDHSNVISRNVTSLALKRGQDYRLLYPRAENRGYEISLQSRKITTGMELKEELLPPGKYLLEYEIDDLFMNRRKLEKIEFFWDGTDFRFADDFEWSGIIVVNEG